MAAFVPRGYGGVPTFQFSPPNHMSKRHHHGRYAQPMFAPHYPTQPLYQPPFNPIDKNLSTGLNQAQKPRIGAQFETFVNRLDLQYRQEQYLRKLHKMQNQQGTPRVVYEFEKETRYVPIPILVPSRGRSYGTSEYLGYNYPWNMGSASGANFNFGAGGSMSLPPKVRVIFIPSGQPSLQQPYIGPLTMPPFLYNRIAQPLAAFPLPPPLPQLGMLPLTPAVQEIVAQRYSNPVAVLPFTSNWQIPRLMMPSYPQMAQQQQEPMAPMSAFQLCSSAPQSYISPSMPAFSSISSAPQQYIFSLPVASMPPYSSLSSDPQPYISPPAAPTLGFPSLPPAAQSYIPPPVAPTLGFPSLPPAPQSYIPPPDAPIQVFSSFPAAPQSYIPPPAITAGEPFMMPPSSLQLPLPASNVFSSFPQYSNNSYPSMCRACPPAPPPLSIFVTGYCWVQHCCACHHVSTPDSNLNVRPAGGRITPLLRYPRVPQYVPDQTVQQQQQQYFHDNAPVMMRPWLRKTPPLPPGGVLISDEYITGNGSYPQNGCLQRQPRQHYPSSSARHRSATIAPPTTFKTPPGPIQQHDRSISPRKRNQTNNNPTHRQGSVKSKSSEATTESSTVTSGLSTEYQKTTMHPPKVDQNAIPPQLANESRNVNLKYNYQPQELPSVYLLNRYLKSSSETSTLSSNNETSPDCSSPSIKEDNQTLLPSSDVNPRKEEPNSEKEDAKPNRFRSQPKIIKEKLIIIREFISSSPSTLSSVSSDIAFSIIDKDEDSISTTSTIKVDN